MYELVEDNIEIIFKKQRDIYLYEKFIDKKLVIASNNDGKILELRNIKSIQYSNFINKIL